MIDEVSLEKNSFVHGLSQQERLRQSSKKAILNNEQSSCLCQENNPEHRFTSTLQSKWIRAETIYFTPALAPLAWHFVELGLFT